MFNNIKLVKLPETIGLAALWWCKKLPTSTIGSTLTFARIVAEVDA